MTDLPTVAELRTVQAECPDFRINRETLALMENVAAGRVRHTTGRRDILTPRMENPGGYASGLGGKVRLLWDAGMAVLGADDVWTLTVPGVRRAVDTRSEYAALRVTAGR